MARPPGQRSVPVMAAIEVEDLFKSYGTVNAVRGISFTVEEGEVFALLGPNGAGKTTTLEILEGHRRRSGGNVAVLGHDPHLGGRALRERIGIVLQSAGIDGELTVGEALRLYAGFYPHPLPVDELISMVGLDGKSRARIKTLSGGQQRRVDLALALVGDPDLIFLDEPTTGFDPAARHGAWQLVDGLRALGRTIILTSHYMDEVQHLADRAVVIVDGRVVAEGKPATLGTDLKRETLISFLLPRDHGTAELPAGLRSTVRPRDGKLMLRTTDPTRTLMDLCGWAVAEDLELRALEVSHPSLEDIYLQLTEGERNGHA
jgi:ABC-2 type transport system ATP-binding protein